MSTKVGDVIDFDRLDDLPTRDDFIDKKLRARDEELAEKGKPLLFMPGPHHEMSLMDSSDRAAKYTLVLFGNMESGQRRTVVIKDYMPFFAIRVPDEKKEEPNRFLIDIRSKLSEDKETKSVDGSVEMHWRYDGYEEFKHPYIVLKFDKLKTRNKAIKKCRMDYLCQTGWDDSNSAHARMFSRTANFSLTMWLQLEDYSIEDDSDFADEEVIKVSYENVKTFTGKMDRPTLVRERTLMAYWDIETYSRDHSVPKHDAKDTNMFDLSVVFYWCYERKPLVGYLITCRPTSSVEGYITLVCENELQLILTFSKLVSLMRPELIGAFNGGGYDWPWLINRAKRWDILPEVALNMTSVLPYKKQSADDIMQWNCSTERIKIEADLDVEEFVFKVPGLQVFDVQTLFRKQYPADGQWSLNYFLTKCNLPAKDDVSAQEMFLWHEQMEKIQDHPLFGDMLKYEKRKKLRPINEKYSDSILRHQATQFDNIGDEDESTLKKVKEARKARKAQYENMGDAEKEAEIVALYGEYKDVKAKLTKALKYNGTDSCRCHDLMLKKGIIADCRMMAHISKCTLFDALYRAGGCKVTNFLIDAAAKGGYVASAISTKVKTGQKYPGARVINPKPGVAITKLTPQERKRKNEWYRQQQRDFPDLYTDSTIEERQGLPYPKWDKVTDIHIARFESHLREHPEIIPDAMPEIEARALAKELGIPNCFAEYCMEKTGSPITGLDFSSLYPSVDMAYNLSPDKLICADTHGSNIIAMQLAKELEAKGEDLHRIEFPYGNMRVLAWCIRHQNKPEKMGVIPKAYIDLFALRKKYKIPMDIYKYVKEINNKVKRQDPMSLWEIMAMTIEHMPSMNDVDKFLNTIEMYPTQEEIDSLKAFIQTEDFNLNSVSMQKTLGDKAMEDYKNFTNETGNNTITFKKVCESTFGHIYIAEWKRLMTAKYQCLSACIPIDDVDFYASRFDGRQNQVKLFMNTIYGVLGNQLSSLYHKEIAGGITTGGQHNLDIMVRTLTAEGCEVRYGDTDSNYPTAPAKVMASLHQKYFSGQMDKMKYWEEMVLAMFKEGKRLRDVVNAAIKADNGTSYLGVAFEDALWPYLLLRKKKYVAVIHVNVPNFLVTKLEKLFLRGIEAKKRGTSKLTIAATEHILLTVFSPLNLLTLRELGVAEIDLIYRNFNSGKLGISDFIKSAKYQPITAEARMNGKGNKSMLTFADRMEARGTPLTPHTRVEYVIVRKYPHRFDTAGRKKQISTGDRMETVEYATENKLEIDIDYYMMNYICGQLAPFISYHADFYEAPNDKADNPNLEAKRAGDLSNKRAKKFLTEYCKTYVRKLPDRGPLMRMFAHTARDTVKRAYLKEDEGDKFTLINSDFLLGTAAKFKASVIKYAEKLAGREDDSEDRAEEFVKKLCKNRKNSKDKNNYIFALYKEYVTKPSSKLNKAREEYENLCARQIAALGMLIDTVRSTMFKHISIMEESSRKLRKLCNVEFLLDDPNKPLPKRKTIDGLLEAAHPDDDADQLLEEYEKSVHQDVKKFLKDNYHVRGIECLSKVVKKIKKAKLTLMKTEAIADYVTRKARKISGSEQPDDEVLTDFIGEITKAIDDGETIEMDDTAPNDIKKALKEMKALKKEKLSKDESDNDDESDHGDWGDDYAAVADSDAGDEDDQLLVEDLYDI